MSDTPETDRFIAGFLSVIADLQDTIARLRDECDLWKAEAEKWRDIAYGNRN